MTGKERYKEAVHNFDIAIDHAAAITPRTYGSTLKEVHWRYTKAWTQKRMGYSDEAFSGAHEALEMARQNRDGRGECQALTLIGWTHENLGNNEESMQFYKDALRVAHTIGDHRMKFNNLQYVGCHYSHILFNHSEALPIWEAALHVAQ